MDPTVLLNIVWLGEVRHHTFLEPNIGWRPLSAEQQTFIFSAALARLFVSHTSRLCSALPILYLAHHWSQTDEVRQFPSSSINIKHHCWSCLPSPGVRLRVMRSDTALVT